ncbi:hypothetical protein [uncultured Bacteroides sp.]|uniref:hypothetical protein n=1 Tax=uncultured Bacteroides sp. TaxID=162156 RepID=UPI002AA94036|nr:hypothetical protein [uncultured Bacteroides sp.]
MKDLKKYFDSTLGVNVVIKPLKEEKMKGLPYFVIGNYNLFTTELFGSELLLVEVKEDITANRLRKQLDIIQTIIQLTAIAVLKPIEAYNRLRLIEKKIPFVIPGKQMYMPSLLIDLKEFGVNQTVKQEVMQPAAQLLLLFHLQVESLEGLNLKTIAEKLEYNATTITRAVKYLLINNLCELQGTKDKFLHFSFTKKELWTNTEPLMTNPIKKTTYYTGLLKDQYLRKSNINALSNYSDLNPTAMESYAAKPAYIKLLKVQNADKIGQKEGEIRIEEWKYDPAKLSHTEFIDRLSLYLCFRDNKNERIENALEQLIDNVEW